MDNYINEFSKKMERGSRIEELRMIVKNYTKNTQILYCQMIRRRSN